MPGLDAVLFDMDGTLVDREPLMRRAAAEVCTSAGVPADEADLARFTGRAWQDVHLELEVAQHTGWTLAMFLDRVLSRADALAEAGFPVAVLTGAVELVRDVAARGVPLALVTGSTAHEAATTLRRLGVEQAFGVVLAAEHYALGKPAPDCYLAAAAELGVRPPRCVAFEDSQPGIAAARAAGMRVVANAEANPDPGDPGHQDLSAADAVVAALAEVDLEWLRELVDGRDAPA